MQLNILDPVGVEITDMPINHIDTDGIAALRTLLAEHGVLVLPGQAVDDVEFIAFLSKFGDLTFTPGEKPVPDYPDLNVISNVGRTTPPRSVFHTDTSYVSHPPEYTALRAVEIPAHGGETLFTNQYLAYERLSPEVREQLTGRSVNHVMTGLALPQDAETAARHPIFLQHPISGRTALYLSTPERCIELSGMQNVDAKEMIEFLYRHSTTQDNILRHAWSAGDVVMWDNRCVLHRADHAVVVGDRVMHRGMVTEADMWQRSG